MFKKKKSPFPAILAIILIAGLAIGGWFITTQKGKETAQAQEELITTDIGTDTHTHDHDGTSHTHSHDGTTHTHDDHDNTASNTNGTVGDVGTIHDIAIDPVLGRRALGDPNAPVQIREYYSLTCNHCANFHTGAYQELKSKYIDTGKVYFIFEEFPLNGPALYGAMIARCMPVERYEAFHGMLLKTQDQWAFGGNFKEALKQNAKLAGMGEEEFDACFNNETMQKAMANNISKASNAWEISSTPTFVFNNGARILRGVRPIADFDAVIADLTNNQAPAPATAPAQPTQVEETPAE